MGASGAAEAGEIETAMRVLVNTCEPYHKQNHGILAIEQVTLKKDVFMVTYSGCRT